MAETIYRGPAISIGALMGNVATATGQQVGVLEPFDGPGIEYQANTFPDPRFGPFNKDSLKVGRIPTWLNSPYVVMADGVGQATGAAVVAAAQNATSATPFTLATVAVGGTGTNVLSIAPSVPLLPMTGGSGQSFPTVGALQSVMALDFGFTTGNTNGTATVTVPDSTLFYQGQWICIGGAGNAGKTLPLICQVLTIPTATTITVSPTPASTLNNSPIGSANAYGLFPQQLTANGVNPYWAAGVAAVFNPLESVTRNLTVTGVAGGTGGAFLCKGFDVYGMPMSETITATAGATSVVGNKAFKYVASITPQFTDAHTYSFGIGNKTGFHLRSDRWEYANIFYNGGFATSSAGYTAAVTTAPTSSTGDVRGTIDVSALATIGSAFDGVKRLTLMMSVALFNLINGNPVSAVSLLGQTQA